MAKERWPGEQRILSVYVISDLHLGHRGMMTYRAGFAASLAEHDQKIVEAWNKQVRKRDTVFVLGDFIWNRKSLHNIERLHGQINWILGNHDPKITRAVMNEIDINFCAGVWPYKHGVVFSHVPIHPNELDSRWKYNVHGHIHLEKRSLDDPRYFNVNADIVGFTPLPFDFILEGLAERCQQPLVPTFGAPDNLHRLKPPFR